MNKKVFILDTNVILSDPEAIFHFDDNIVIIPSTVLEELDKFKKDKSEVGAAARSFIRSIDKIRGQGNLVKGIDNLTVFLWESIAHKAMNYVDSDFKSMDDRILAITRYVTLNDHDKQVILVTNDLNLRVRADIFSIRAEEYKHNRTESESTYPGVRTIDVEKDIIEEIYDIKSISIDSDFYPNECIILKNGKQSALSIYNSSKDRLDLLPQVNKVCNIAPRSVEQQFGLSLLTNKDIPLVSLLGPAGTGKSLLAVAAGLKAVLEDFEYERIMLLKPIVAMNDANELGYIPGDLISKLTPWMASYVDNINVIMKNYFDKDSAKSSSKKKKQSFSFDEKSAGKTSPVDELMEMGLLEFGSLSHLRGRSINNTYIIIDELQNIPGGVALKSLFSRVGEGSKIVACGDEEQIDNPYLDKYSNGLSVLIEAVKNSDLTAHITLTKSERSKLAEMIVRSL